MNTGSAHARRALITGIGSQLAAELLPTTPHDWEVVTADRNQLDLSCRHSVLESIARVAPAVIINTAAYTAVDKAEANVDQAFAINELGARYVGEAAARFGCRVIHLSTDFVFDGFQDKPYRPSEPAAAINVYGQSKLAGEKQLVRIIPTKVVIVRTSWLYSSHRKNFVKTILKNLHDRESLQVVADQRGSPTWARSLAAVIWLAALDSELCGTFHWSDGGETTWYDFAVAIQQEANAVGLLCRSIPIVPVKTSEYPTAAARPRYSVLDSSETIRRLRIKQTPWKTNLRAMLEELASHPDAASGEPRENARPSCEAEPLGSD